MISLASGATIEGVPSETGCVGDFGAFFFVSRNEILFFALATGVLGFLFFAIGDGVVDPFASLCLGGEIVVADATLTLVGSDIDSAVSDSIGFEDTFVVDHEVGILALKAFSWVRVWIDTVFSTARNFLELDTQVVLFEIIVFVGGVNLGHHALITLVFIVLVSLTVFSGG